MKWRSVYSYMSVFHTHICETRPHSIRGSDLLLSLLWSVPVLSILLLIDQFSCWWAFQFLGIKNGAAVKWGACLCAPECWVYIQDSSGELGPSACVCVSRSCQSAFQSDSTSLPLHLQRGIKLHRYTSWHSLSLLGVEGPVIVTQTCVFGIAATVEHLCIRFLGVL